MARQDIESTLWKSSANNDATSQQLQLAKKETQSLKDKLHVVNMDIKSGLKTNNSLTFHNAQLAARNKLLQTLLKQQRKKTKALTSTDAFLRSCVSIRSRQYQRTKAISGERYRDMQVRIEELTAKCHRDTIFIRDASEGLADMTLLYRSSLNDNHWLQSRYTASQKHRDVLEKNVQQLRINLSAQKDEHQQTKSQLEQVQNVCGRTQFWARFVDMLVQGGAQ